MYGLSCAPACQQGKIRETISILKNRPGTLGRLISAITRATIDSSICNFFEFFILATQSQDTLLFKVRCASPVLSMDTINFCRTLIASVSQLEKPEAPKCHFQKPRFPAVYRRNSPSAESA